MTDAPASPAPEPAPEPGPARGSGDDDDMHNLSWLSPSLDEAGRQEIVRQMVRMGRLDADKLPPSLVGDLRQADGPPPDAPAVDPETDHSAAMTRLMDDAMAGLKAEDYALGPGSKFGLNVRHDLDEDGVAAPWNEEAEAQARTWFEAAGFNAGDAATMTWALDQVRNPDFNQDAAFTQSSDYIVQRYGGENIEGVLNGLNWCLHDIGGDELVEFVVDHGLANHPALVRKLCDLAEQRGMIARGAA